MKKLREPNCHFFEEGLEFKDEDTMYNSSFEKDFFYRLSNQNKATKITFESANLGVYSYDIHIISEDEMGFKGVGHIEDKSCYLGRQ